MFRIHSFCKCTPNNWLSGNTHRFQAVDHCTNRRDVRSAENLAQSEGGRLAADNILRVHGTERREHAIKKMSSKERKVSFRRNTDCELIGLYSGY